MSTPDEAVVARLLETIGGPRPTEEARHLLAPDVVCHMDRFTARGFESWAAWISFIRSRGVDGLEAVVDRMVTGPGGLVTAHGRLRGERRGRPVSAGDGSATYRVEDGRIVEIWTTRRNYEVIFGRMARHPLSWLLVLAYLAVWSRLPGRGVHPPGTAAWQTPAGGDP
jgi:hypothetical protein